MHVKLTSCANTFAPRDPNTHAESKNVNGEQTQGET